MKLKFAMIAAVIAAFAFTAPSANAGGRHHHHHHFGKLTAVSIGVGAAATTGYFAINSWHWNWQGNAGIPEWGAVAATTIGCMAVAPMVGTLVMDRPLTVREVHVLAGSCVIPILGGWLVNAAYDAHPEWDAGDHPHWKKHHHKMKMKM
jgi:hypothetical protein